MVENLNTNKRKRGELLSIVSTINFKTSTYLITNVEINEAGTHRVFELVVQSTEDPKMRVGSEVILPVPLSEPLNGSVYNREAVALLSAPDKLRGATISIVKLLVSEYSDLQASLDDVIEFLKAAGYLELGCGEKRAKNFIRNLATTFPGFFSLTQKGRVLQYTGKPIDHIDVPDASKAGEARGSGPITVDFPTLVHGIRMVLASFSCFKIVNDGDDE